MMTDLVALLDGFVASWSGFRSYGPVMLASPTSAVERLLSPDGLSLKVKNALIGVMRDMAYGEEALVGGVELLGLSVVGENGRFFLATDSSSSEPGWFLQLAYRDGDASDWLLAGEILGTCRVADTRTAPWFLGLVAPHLPGDPLLARLANNVVHCRHRTYL